MWPRISIENRISRIRVYSEKLKLYHTGIPLKSDDKLLYSFERLSFLVIQSSIDLAGAVISIKGLRKPETLADSFEILREAKFLTIELSERLVRMVGFRNMLSNDYENISAERMHTEVLAGLTDIDELIKSVEFISF